MFSKNECSKCNKKINSKYDFCPYCGFKLNSKKEDLGMLGKDDNLNESNQFNSILGNMGGDFMNKMIGGAMRMLQRELQKEMKNKDIKPGTNFKLMINGREVNLNNAPVKKVVKKEVKSIKLPSMLSSEDLKKFSSLPREEPVTNVRRLSDKIVYEIEMKEIESIKNLAIIRLENSVEVKAVSKEKSYFKVIPLNLPLVNYNLLKDKLVLEFEVK